MKKLILVISLIFIILFGNSQSGLIYNFTFRVDNQLITQIKTQNKNNKILNLSTVEDLPKELSENVLKISEQKIGEYLKINLSSFKPADKLIMGALPEHLMYLPANTFKKTIKKYDTTNFFIDIKCHIEASGGKKIILSNKSFSNVNPKISLKIRVLNSDKVLVEKKESILKDFEKLRSKTFEKTYGIKSLAKNTDLVTISETINSDDILRMYLLSIEEALN